MPARRIACTLAGAVLVALTVPAVAAAHLRLGTLAVDFRVSVLGPRSASDAAFAVSVSRDQRSLELTVRRGHRVLVVGYLGEPVLRIDGRGTFVNLASPTAGAAAVIPNGAATNRGPRWVRLDMGRRAVWRDPRLQQLPPGSELARWTVPLVVDGGRTSIVGEVGRLPSPSLWPWLLLVLATTVAAVAVAHRWARVACTVLGGVAAAAGIVTAGAFALEAPSTGIRVAAVYELVFALGGAGFVFWGPRETRVAAAAWLGLVGLIGGLACSQMFLHPVLLSVLPATVTRAVGALSIALGAASIALGGLFYARTEKTLGGDLLSRREYDAGRAQPSPSVSRSSRR